MKNYIYILRQDELELYKFLRKEKAIKLDEYCLKRNISHREAMKLINQLKKRGLVKVKYNPKVYVIDD